MGPLSGFWALNILMLMLLVPSGVFLEYGTIGLLFASCGWMARHKKEFVGKDDWLILSFGFTSIVYVLSQQLFFGFEDIHVITLAIGMVFVSVTLFFFRPITFPDLTKTMPKFMTAILQFTGRRTLEIYVAHIIILQVICFFVDPERFQLFEFQLFYGGKDQLSSSILNEDF